MSEFFNSIGEKKASHQNYIVKNSEVEPGLLLRWSPVFNSIIAFVNPSSGGRKGEAVLELLKKFLPPENVFNLHFGGPKLGLEKHKDNDVGLRIIAAGGDGTVGWVLAAIDKIQFLRPTSVCIVPLGTGNDLARVLGWEDASIESTKLFLSKVAFAKQVQLDRWSIKSKSNQIANSPIKAQFEIKNKLPLEVINNYFSLGADAEVALYFHTAREKNPHDFDSKTFNKIKYGQFSAKYFLNHFSNEIELVDNIEKFECDDFDFLPKIRSLKVKSILVLNIPSYAGGTNPWPIEKGYQNQSFSDGKLEIIGFSIMDFTLLKLGGHGHAITQASKIRIVTTSPNFMQIDGEPCLLEASDILISLKSQSTMLSLKE